MSKTNHIKAVTNPGVAAALAAAALFGAGTPLAKGLLGTADPWLLAGLLYLGSGIGLALWRLGARLLVLPPARLQGGQAQAAKLPPGQWRWLAGAVLAGGVVGPLLLMLGLSRMPASGVSLLLNAEGVFTALLAWFVFKENVDRRIALGMAAIVAGALVLSWPGAGGGSVVGVGQVWPALAVLGACAAWAIDNNLTRKVALADATWIACVKGLVAGSVNLALGLAAGAAWPPPPTLAAALVLGLLAYGISLTLFVVGLRHLGTARTGAYFSVAPFFGAALAVWWLGESVTPALLVAGALMALGVWLHLTEQHAHLHTHEPLEHDHAHVHDAHHEHEEQDEHHEHRHDPAQPASASSDGHPHPHRHAAITHSHPHFPDAHHRHTHRKGS
jgi:drug/metabolite transporter (DMT)-like permease